MTKIFTVEDENGKTCMATTSMKTARRMVMNLGRKGHGGNKIYYWRFGCIKHQVRRDIDDTARTRKGMTFLEWHKLHVHVQKHDRLERVPQES